MRSLLRILVVARSVVPALVALLFVVATQDLVCQTNASRAAEGFVSEVVNPPSIETSTIDASRIQERTLQLESSTSGDTEARERLLETYRRILGAVKATRDHMERSEAFRESLELAPAEIERMRSDSQNPLIPATTDPVAATFQEAQTKLSDEQTALIALRSRLTELDARIETERNRPVIVQSQLVETRRVVDEMEFYPDSRALAVDGSEQARAQRMLSEARQQLRHSELRMLEQELLSNPIRVELLESARDQVAARIANREISVRALEARVSELRSAEARRVQNEAESLAEDAEGKHPLVQAQAEEIAKLASELRAVTPSIDEVVRKGAVAESEVAEARMDLEEVARTLDLGDITEPMGTVLLEQRRNLKSGKELKREFEEITTDESKARLRLFKLDRELREMGNLTIAVETLIENAGTLSVDAADFAEIVTELEALLLVKRRQLESLRSAYRDYSNALVRLELAHGLLMDTMVKMTLLLDENLLWIQNATPLDWETWYRLRDHCLEILAGEKWSPIVSGMIADVRNRWLLYSLFSVALASLFVMRRRLSARLERQATFIGKVHHDNLMITVAALIVTFLIAAPFGLFLGFIGWRLLSIGDDVSRSLGLAAMISALTYFLIRFVRAICRPSGVGAKHFRWDPDSLSVIRRELFWFLPVATSCSFLIAFTESYANPEYRDTFGRLGFIGAMIAASLLAYRILGRKRGRSNHGENQEGNWVLRARALWALGACLMPIALVAIACLGYYYMAIALEYRLNHTIILILVAVGFYAFLYRWLAISQRRLAFKIAVEKRQARLKSREAEEDEDEDELGVADWTPDIDVDEVGEQTVELLRMSIGLLFILGLWFIWAGTFPALRILDNVELWSHSTLVDGQETLIPITLTNLLLSLGILIVTTFAARNMPGFLEIALLQGLPVDRGSRYAIRTLALYAIVAIGIGLAFNAIGIGWSSVQWLVAALTVGLGFGLQEIFGNFVSGLIILLERPIRVGDTVTVGSISGVVTKIRMRATTITDWNRKELIVPNKSFITGELINWSLSDPTLRLDFVVGIAYGSDTTLAHKTLLKVCEEHPMVLDQPDPTAFFTGFGDNSLEFQVRVFVSETNNAARTRIVHDLHMAIDAAFREHGICIAFPQRDVHLDTLSPLEVRVSHLGGPRVEGSENVS